ncbi:hypothetical protein B0H17DRAFT_1329168 [Mycena rosella]|uniref:Uncharacterized protein n=1 Tax=Mycena rosella TaxID=1033263 RepID=A0AAD7DPX3_MYCRO|nr:hypothetical protein B0H17DRAFT_1329168 [Mycena rosella]
MVSIAENSLSLITSVPPTINMNKVLVGVVVLTVAAFTIHRASPIRLTRNLVAAIADAEKTYLEALEAGVSNSELHTAERLSSLQLKVSTIHEATLCNSLSYRAAFCAFLKGHSLTVLYSIREVREFETHIEIMKESHLRALDPHTVAEAVTRAVSLRRRRTHFPCSKL